MNSLRHIILFLLLLIITSLNTKAQDSSRRFLRDTSRLKDTLNRDTTKRRMGMSVLFADTAQLTPSDYQLQIEKTYVTLNRIDKESELGQHIIDIQGKLTEIDAALSAIGDNLNGNNKALNLRNLQMYSTLLEHIHDDVEAQKVILDGKDKELSLLRNDMRDLRKDTVFMQLMRDSALKVMFAQQLKTMRGQWRSSLKDLKASIDLVQQLQTNNSKNAITAFSLQEKTANLLASSRERIFGKEFNYLWEQGVDTSARGVRRELRRTYISERKALRYYFKESGSRRILLLLITLLFFGWIYRNIHRVKKWNSLSKLKELDVEYIYPAFILSSFIVMFSIGPLFDLDAPAVYVEMMQFLLLIALTVLCWKKWPRQLFRYWVVMAILFICFSLTHNILVPGFLQRCWLIILNVASVIFGYLFLTRISDHIKMKGFLRFVIVLHNIMNVIAILCNLFGRFSLAQILGSTAIFAFTQIIGLAVFSKIIMEAIVLQIETSRLKQGIRTSFDFTNVRTSFQKPIALIVAIIWLIVFTTNLNVYNSLFDVLTAFLKKGRSIGSASFTLGGILLFFFIIWMAHLLQKYVGYFFGETGSDEDIQNKEQRSKMLIARLVVLCAGYLLAVGASGLPIDKITIVLGALGVGIGLGLQNIVSNFMSGIILIFDRPLQIGDAVEMDNVAGKVKEIGLRSSTLLTPAGAEVIIPNGDILSQKITNWTLSNNQQRIEMELSVTGSTEKDSLITLIKETILFSKYIFEKREPQILVTAIQKDGFTLKVLFWCAEVSKSQEVKSEILYLLHNKLSTENITIK